MESKKKFRPNPDSKLMEQCVEVLRYYHYAYKTEQTYCTWIRRYIRFYGDKQHPKTMGAAEVERYLSHLANEGHVAAATQRQALNAIVFLYRDVLDIELGSIAPTRSKREVRPPTVMTKEEVRLVLTEMTGVHKLMALLMYGCGMRLMECVRLRVQDVDFGQGHVYIREGKGGKDRTVPLPEFLSVALSNQMDHVKHVHENDLRDGYGEVYLPHALARKYRNAEREPGWQYVFPAKQRSLDPRSGKTRRHHVLESGIQKAVKAAVKRAGLVKRVTCHTFRHSFATHLLEDGVTIRKVQVLMGHKDVKTTEIYTHVMQQDIKQVQSPLDTLFES